MFCRCPYQGMTAFTPEAWWWPTLWFINMGSDKTCFSRSTDTRDVVIDIAESLLFRNKIAWVFDRITSAIFNDQWCSSNVNIAKYFARISSSSRGISCHDISSLTLVGFDTLQMAAIPKMHFDSRECDVICQRPIKHEKKNIYISQSSRNLKQSKIKQLGVEMFAFIFLKLDYVYICQNRCQRWKN